jgi:hypothetical protein
MTPHLTAETLGALALAIAGVAAVTVFWHKADLRRKLAADRAAWRSEIARGLESAATAAAKDSAAAAAAITTIAEALQGTGEMGYLESCVLRERILAGVIADKRRSRQDLHLRIAHALGGIAGARELIHVMLPETRRDTSLRDDAIATLDAASAACKGLAPAPPATPLQRSPSA